MSSNPAPPATIAPDTSSTDVSPELIGSGQEGTIGDQVRTYDSDDRFIIRGIEIERARTWYRLEEADAPWDGMARTLWAQPHELLPAER